jgi:hypothetical protein
LWLWKWMKHCQHDWHVKAALAGSGLTEKELRGIYMKSIPPWTDDQDQKILKWLIRFVAEGERVRNLPLGLRRR